MEKDKCLDGIEKGIFILSMPIFVSDTPLSPMGPSSPSQEGLFTDLRLLSLEKQLNIELKVDHRFEENDKRMINSIDAIVSSKLYIYINLN